MFLDERPHMTMFNLCHTIRHTICPNTLAELSPRVQSVPRVSDSLALTVLITGVLTVLLASPLSAATPSAQPTPDQPTLTVTTSVLPDEPDPPPTYTPFKAQAGEHADADQLLTALERSGDSLQTLSADLKYFRRMNELEGGETQIRTGTLLFRTRPSPDKPSTNPESSPSPRREFQIDFTRLEIDNKARDESQTFIFDGEWLVERYPNQKEIHRRQVVAPGQFIDPLAIGEGPFPIPIGQKKQRILDRFEAFLADPADGWEATKPNWLDQTYQLILVPRRGTDEARQYRQIRLWYAKDTLLPRMVRAEEADESRTEVLLFNVVPNQPLPSGAFDTSLPEGWNERVDTFRPAANR